MRVANKKRRKRGAQHDQGQIKRLNGEKLRGQRKRFGIGIHERQNGSGVEAKNKTDRQGKGEGRQERHKGDPRVKEYYLCKLPHLFPNQEVLLVRGSLQEHSLTPHRRRVCMKN